MLSTTIMFQATYVDVWKLENNCIEWIVKEKVRVRHKEDEYAEEKPSRN